MFLYGPSKGVRKSVHSRKFGREILIFAVMSQNVMSIWSVQIMDIGLNFIDRRILIFTKVEDAWERKLIITFISCSHLYSTFKSFGPFTSVNGSISMNSPEIRKKVHNNLPWKTFKYVYFSAGSFCTIETERKGFIKTRKAFFFDSFPPQRVTFLPNSKRWTFWWTQTCSLYKTKILLL